MEKKLLLSFCLLAGLSFASAAEKDVEKKKEKVDKTKVEKTKVEKKNKETDQKKIVDKKSFAPVTLLLASRPNQGSPDGKNGSPFANTLVETLDNSKKTTQQSVLSDFRKRYIDNLEEQNITHAGSYLIDPWINSQLPLCGENSTYIITIGANDYDVGRLKNAVSDADNVQTALTKYCPKTKVFSVRELAFSSSIVYQFLEELKNAKEDEKSKKGNSLIIYYSGFGASDNNNNYLLSPRTNISESANDLNQAKQSIIVGDLEQKIAELGGSWRSTVLLDTGFPSLKKK